MRALVLFVSAIAGCATSPIMLPAAPMPGAVVQAGAAPYAAVGVPGLAAAAGVSPEWAVGGVGFVDGALPNDIHLVASGHGAYVRAFDQTAAVPQRFIGGGRGAIRWVRPMLGDHLFVGVEGGAGYLTTTGGPTVPTSHFVIAQVGLPVAEVSPIPGLHVYASPTIGLVVPLHAGADTPFAGYTELPLGVSWQVLPWLVLIAEGGLSQPVSGPYLSAGAAVRL